MGDITKCTTAVEFRTGKEAGPFPFLLLREMLAFFVPFPGSFGEGDTAERAGEFYLGFLLGLGLRGFGFDWLWDWGCVCAGRWF